ALLGAVRGAAVAAAARRRLLVEPHRRDRGDRARVLGLSPIDDVVPRVTVSASPLPDTPENWRVHSAFIHLFAMEATGAADRIAVVEPARVADARTLVDLAGRRLALDSGLRRSGDQA